MIYSYFYVIILKTTRLQFNQEVDKKFLTTLRYES